MGDLTAPQRHVMGTGETRNVGVSFLNMLDTDELLTGTPTVTEQTTSDLTLGTKQVNVNAETINGVSNAAGQAVMFTVTGGSANTDYTIRILCGTDASTPQTLEAFIRIRFEDS